MKAILILLLLMLSSCSKSEVVIEKEITTKAQDTTYTPKHRPHKPKDTTDKGEPIKFTITVEDWKEDE